MLSSCLIKAATCPLARFQILSGLLIYNETWTIRTWSMYFPVTSCCEGLGGGNLYLVYAYGQNTKWSKRDQWKIISYQPPSQKFFFSEATGVTSSQCPSRVSLHVQLLSVPSLSSPVGPNFLSENLNLHIFSFYWGLERELCQSDFKNLLLPARAISCISKQYIFVYIPSHPAHELTVGLYTILPLAFSPDLRIPEIITHQYTRYFLFLLQAACCLTVWKNHRLPDSPYLQT